MTRRREGLAVKRWAVICRDVEGTKHLRHEFVLRWSARRYARALGGEKSLTSLRADREAFVTQMELIGPELMAKGLFTGIATLALRTYTVEVERLTALGVMKCRHCGHPIEKAEVADRPPFCHTITVTGWRAEPWWTCSTEDDAGVHVHLAEP